jgi:transcriptional regulator
MYVPAHFAMTDEQITQVLSDLGQADLVTQHADGLLATPLPLLFDASVGDRGALLGHVARNNPQWSRPCLGESLVIAHLTDHYVSPAWLVSTAQHGQTVPTWDYVTVHAYGELVAHDDPAWTLELVRRLTDHHEALRVAGGTAAAAAPAWSVDHAPADYLQRMLRAIVGLELRITRIEAKAKMAQNKTPADVAALGDALAAQGDAQGVTWLTAVSAPAAARRAEVLAEVAGRRAITRPGSAGPRQ